MLLTVDKSLDLLNIPKAKFKVAGSLSEAKSAAKSFKLPVVLKLVSPKVIHKTDKGGVVIARSNSELVETSKRFLKKGNVLVQEHISGVEFFLGIKDDPVFGHVLLAGLGGIFVEVYKDVAFRVCPISKADAKSMLDELKGRALLEGARGMKPVDMSKLVDAMVAVSRLPDEVAGLKELDVNPLFVSHNGVKAVDARIVLKGAKFK